VGTGFFSTVFNGTGTGIAPGSWPVFTVAISRRWSGCRIRSIRSLPQKPLPQLQLATDDRSWPLGKLQIVNSAHCHVVRRGVITPPLLMKFSLVIQAAALENSIYIFPLNTQATTKEYKLKYLKSPLE